MTKDAKKRLIVAALACAVLLIAFLSVLPNKSIRLAGGNAVPAKKEMAALAPGQRACQTEDLVPEGARRVVLGATTLGLPGSTLEASVSHRGEVISNGRLAGGYRDIGIVEILMTPIERTVRGATVCLVNRGPSVVRLYGSPTASGTPLTAAGTKVQGVLAVIWRGKSESWASLVPAIVDHVDAGSTQAAGSLTLWLVLALVLAAGLAAIVLVLREADR